MSAVTSIHTPGRHSLPRAGKFAVQGIRSGSSIDEDGCPVPVDVVYCSSKSLCPAIHAWGRVRDEVIEARMERDNRRRARITETRSAMFAHHL